jgi:LuxR family maltose regulon positive regulatory protein
MAVRRMLDRQRLTELMAMRWTRRVVTVVAGPGFGKSVLLAQSASENRLAPHGTQITLECGGQDRWPHHFLQRLADAIGCEVESSTISPEWITAELARRWPMGVCLVLDDVHHLTDTAEGERVLSRLVTGAPSSVHFVLAGRRPVRGLSRLKAAGEVVPICERDLALTDSECRALAEAHGADAEVVGASGGWPAVAAIAATYGVSGATDYVWEAVLDRLDRWQRRVVATAALIGPCDPALLRAAVGEAPTDPVEVMDAVPLVRSADDGSFHVHDLWQPVVAGVLDESAVGEAIGRAASFLTGCRSFDRAFRLCAAHRRWEQVNDILDACCAGGYADVRPHVLEGWLDLLPDDQLDRPSGVLLQGLASRARDPFGVKTSDLLERAAACHRSSGDVTGEVAATNELAFVLRNQGRCDEVAALVMRVAELHAAGHRQAAGSTALFRSVLAEASGDARGIITELDALPPRALSPEWQAIAEFRRATAALTLGDEAEMVQAATRCAALAGETSTMRHVVALTAWYAGDPQPALADCDSIIADAASTPVDGLALGAFATMILATAGRADEAVEQLRRAERSAVGGAIAPLMRGYLIGIRALLAAAQGDDAEARAVLLRALGDEPLDGPIGWMMATRWLPLAYVLVPDARPLIDGRQAGDVHLRRIAVARAVAAAGEGVPLRAEDLEGVGPGIVATTVPLRWAMTLCARLASSGDDRGREIVEGLFELFGEPARDALRRRTDSGDKAIVKGARALLAEITLAPKRNVRLDVLGPSELYVGDEPAGPDWNRERVRSLLLLLVVNGASRRDQIIDALWPDLDLDAADRNLRVTLTYLQRLLEPERQRGEAPFFVRQRGSMLAIAGSPHLVVDVDEFRSLTERAAEADRRGAHTMALDLYLRATRLSRGPCLADVVYEEWAQTHCRELDERFVRAAVRAGELHLAEGDTLAARLLARRALAVDAWSESAHRVLVAAALADDDRCGAARALAECDNRLAELGVSASAETEMLRRRLRTPSLVVAVSA